MARKSRKVVVKADQGILQQYNEISSMNGFEKKKYGFEKKRGGGNVGRNNNELSSTFFREALPGFVLAD